MAQVNPLTRELLVKLVYYGPGLGGKTSSLQRIHASSPPETRGQIVSLATPVDRTLYFDFLPLRAQSLRGHHVRLQLFTVPGQVYFNATRKLVLTGADGIVFVADSQRERHDANLESLENLASNLEDQGRTLANVPLVFQYNKRDLPNAMSTEELDTSLNALGVPSFGTNAATGEHVLDALDALVRAVLDDLEARNVLGAPAAPVPEPRFARAEEPLEDHIGRASAEFYVDESREAPTSVYAPASEARAARTLSPAAPAPEVRESVVVPPEPPTAGGLKSTMPPIPDLDGRVGPSFVALFPESEFEVAAIEADFGARRYGDAVGKTDALVRELLARFALELDAPDVTQPALLLPLLSIDASRWLAFRRIAARPADEIGEHEALSAYAFLLELRVRINDAFRH